MATQENIDELKQQEAALIGEVVKFEESYRHRKPCTLYEKTGYCQHVQSAERRHFAEKNRQLIAARLALL